MERADNIDYNIENYTEIEDVAASINAVENTLGAVTGDTLNGIVDIIDNIIDNAVNIVDGTTDAVINTLDTIDIQNGELSGGEIQNGELSGGEIQNGELHGSRVIESKDNIVIESTVDAAVENVTDLRNSDVNNSCIGESKDDRFETAQPVVEEQPCKSNVLLSNILHDIADLIPAILADKKNMSQLTAMQRNYKDDKKIFSIISSIKMHLA